MTDLKKDTVGEIPEALGSAARGHDVAAESTDFPITVSLENIDAAIIHYFAHVINPTISENNALKRVQVIYGSPERWAFVRKDGFLRDPLTSKLLTPLIMIRRSAMSRGQLTNPVNKYLYETLDTGWNAKMAYDKFSIQNNIKPSRKMRQVVIPDYMDLEYEVLMWTEYQEQMNHLIEQVNVESDEYWGSRNNFKFRVQIQDFSPAQELPADSDRLVRTSVNLKVQGYLLPERMIKNFKTGATNNTQFTAKKVILKETIVKDIKKI
jgi:hypothetical protein